VALRLCERASMEWSRNGSAAARQWGSLFNEIPDRISDAATLIGDCGYAAGSSGNPGTAGRLARRPHRLCARSTGGLGRAAGFRRTDGQTPPHGCSHRGVGSGVGRPSCGHRQGGLDDHRDGFRRDGLVALGARRPVLCGKGLDVSAAGWTRLLDPRGAFADPFTGWFVAGVVGLLAAAYGVTFALSLSGRLGAARQRELLLRLHSWAVLIPVMLLPLLLGAFWMILGMLILSVFCYREFARLTGQFRNFRVSLWTVASIGLVYFAVLDKWNGLFAASQMLGVVFIAAGGLYVDQPKGICNASPSERSRSSFSG